MSSPDHWAEQLINYGPSLASEDQNSVADASLENNSSAEPGIISNTHHTTFVDLGLDHNVGSREFDPDCVLPETEEKDTIYKKNSALQPPLGDIVTLVEPGPDVCVNKEPPAKSTFQIDQKADAVVSPFNKPNETRSFSAVQKLKTQSFISTLQQRGSLEICQPSTSRTQRGFTSEGNTVKVSQQLEVGSGESEVPTAPNPNGGTRKRASENGGSKAFQEVNEVQAAKVSKNQTTNFPDYQISANDKGHIKIRQEKNTYRLIAPSAKLNKNSAHLPSVQISNAQRQTRDDRTPRSLLVNPNQNPGNHVPQPQQPDIQSIPAPYIDNPKNNDAQNLNLCNQREHLESLAQILHAPVTNPTTRQQAPTFQLKSGQFISRRPIKDAYKSSLSGQHQHLRSDGQITPALITKLAIESQQPVLQPFPAPAQLTNRPFNNPQTPTLHDRRLPPTFYGNPEPPDKAPDIRVHDDHPSTIPTTKSNLFPVPNCQQIDQTPSTNPIQPTPIIMFILPMILSGGNQVQSASPMVPLLQQQSCVHNGIGMSVIQSTAKRATSTQARTEPANLRSAARKSNRKQNPPKILPCTSKKDKMQDRANSFRENLSFCMQFSSMAKPLADFGYKYIGQCFGEETIQCEGCMMKQKIPNVLKQNPKQVVWHQVGCSFFSTKKPCTKCVKSNTGLCGGCEECQ